MDTSSSGTGAGHTSAARTPLPASSLPRGDAHASAVATPPSTMATSEPGTSRRRPRSRTDEAVAAATPSVGSVEGRALTHAGSSNRRRRRRLSSAALMRAQRGVAAVGGLVGEWRLLREIGKVRVRQVGAVNGALRLLCAWSVSVCVCVRVPTVCAWRACLACARAVCHCVGGCFAAVLRSALCCRVWLNSVWQGSFCTVYLGKHVQNGKEGAVKVHTIGASSAAVGDQAWCEHSPRGRTSYTATESVLAAEKAVLLSLQRFPLVCSLLDYVAYVWS